MKNIKNLGKYSITSLIIPLAFATFFSLSRYDIAKSSVPDENNPTSKTLKTKGITTNLNTGYSNINVIIKVLFNGISANNEIKTNNGRLRCKLKASIHPIIPII